MPSASLTPSRLQPDLDLLPVHAVQHHRAETDDGAEDVQDQARLVEPAVERRQHHRHVPPARPNRRIVRRSPERHARTCGTTRGVRVLVANCSVEYEGRLGARLSRRAAPDHVEGRRLDRGARRRQGLQAAQLDEPAVHGARRPTAARRHQPGRREAHHRAARGAPRLRPSSSARTPAWPRTASRPNCRSSWPSGSRRCARTFASCDASTRPTSARSTCCVATVPGPGRRRRGEAGRRDRRRRAAAPLPGAPRPRRRAWRRRSACSWRRGSSPRRRCSPRAAGCCASRSTSTSCGPAHPSTCGSSEARGVWDQLVPGSSGASARIE